jgi:hypothetical protein
MVATQSSTAHSLSDRSWRGLRRFAHPRRANLLRYPLPRLIAPMPRDEIRMKKMREKLDTFDDARPRPRKICIRIDSVHLDVRDARHLARELHGSFEPVATRRYDDHLRLRAQDIIPLHADGIFAGTTQRIFAAGEGDHLGYPMPATKRWICPLQKDHSTLRSARDLSSQLR